MNPRKYSNWQLVLSLQVQGSLSLTSVHGCHDPYNVIIPIQCSASELFSVVYSYSWLLWTVATVTKILSNLYLCNHWINSQITTQSKQLSVYKRSRTTPHVSPSNIDIGLCLNGRSKLNVGGESNGQGKYKYPNQDRGIEHSVSHYIIIESFNHLSRVATLKRTLTVHWHCPYYYRDHDKYSMDFFITNSIDG